MAKSTLLPMFKDVSIEDLSNIARTNPSFRGYLQGYLSEMFLKQHLEGIPGVSEVRKIPDHSPRKGDFSFLYEGKTYSVESKTFSESRFKKLSPDAWAGFVQLKRTSSAEVDVEVEGVKSKVRTISLARGEFDILSVCSFPVTQRWEFFFINSAFLPESRGAPGYLKSQFSLSPQNTPHLYSDVTQALGN